VLQPLTEKLYQVRISWNSVSTKKNS
jgi:hypothetical protein